MQHAPKTVWYEITRKTVAVWFDLPDRSDLVSVLLHSNLHDAYWTE